eukprot:1402757-Lingulodinium_polyedra.AAC.1
MADAAAGGAAPAVEQRPAKTRRVSKTKAGEALVCMTEHFKNERDEECIREITDWLRSHRDRIVHVQAFIKSGIVLGSVEKLKKGVSCLGEVPFKIQKIALHKACNISMEDVVNSGLSNAEMCKVFVYASGEPRCWKLPLKEMPVE